MQRVLKTIKIGDHNISEADPVFIVAELSANHNRDLNVALRSLDAIKKAGADAVKVQTYRPDSITLDSDNEMFMARKDSHWAGRKLYDLYTEGALPYEWHQEIKSYAEHIGLVFFSAPFDFRDVDFLETLDIPAYKIASLEITDIPLITYVARKRKPVILSTGVATLEDIQLAVNTCLDNGNDQIILLKCTSSYPTPPEDAHLQSIGWLRQEYKTIVGLSDHTTDIYAPMIAVALGARMIEKHFILDRKLKTLDAKFSLNPSEFSKMVKAVRETEKLLGHDTYSLTEKMRKARQSSRSLFAIQDIPKGAPFTENNVKSIRPGLGLHPKFYFQILGKKAARDIQKGSPLSHNDVMK